MRFWILVFALIRCHLWVLWIDIRGIFTNEPSWYAESERYKDGSWRVWARKICFDDRQERTFLELPRTVIPEIATVMVFDNGCVAVFDWKDQQIPEYQRFYKGEVLDRYLENLRKKCTPLTRWEDFRSLETRSMTTDQLPPEKPDESTRHQSHHSHRQ